MGTSVDVYIKLLGTRDDLHFYIFTLYWLPIRVPIRLLLLGTSQLCNLGKSYMLYLFVDVSLSEILYNNEMATLSIKKYPFKVSFQFFCEGYWIYHKTLFTNTSFIKIIERYLLNI